jgi:hypothetical protein
MLPRIPLLAAVLGSLVLGCTGNLGDPPETTSDDPHGPGSETQSFTCNPDATPASVPLRRLSKVQYLHTLRDMVSFALPDEADAIMAAVKPKTDIVPDDQKVGPNGDYGGFQRLDQNVGQDLVDRDYAIATALGAEMTSSPERLTKLGGACATDADSGNDAECLASFIGDFGERALRRPISDEDVAFYSKVAGQAPFDAADWADVTAALLLAPDFLYFVESGGEPVAGKTDVYEVGPYEIASRLSYHFWQTMPDEELLEHARSGDLTDEEVYAQQIDRVFSDPRTRDAIGEFYAEWLHRADVAQINSRVGTPAFDALRGDFDPGPTLREAMFAEVADMAMYYSLDTKGTIEDLYTSKKSFAKDPILASIYGVPVWSGQGDPPDLVEEARKGLLTRAAMVATGSANTRPIMKGVFIRKALLCDTVPPPPANVNAKPIEPEGALTSREDIEALTGGGVCAGCHVTMINALGFSTENFDAIGRFREEELLIDGVTGMLKGKKPVNTVAEPRITDKDHRVAQDSRDVSKWMLESGKVQACFARVYFRFTFGRVEQVKNDGCALQELNQALADGDDLGSVLKRVALSPTFRQKDFGGVK